MATYRNIDDFSPGKTYKIVRDLDAQADGSAVTQARFTVKSAVTLPDSSASIHAVIDLVPTASGACYNYDDGSMAVNFNISPSTTKLMRPNETYYYDIQVTMDSGDIFTIETGKLFTLNTITNLP